MSCVRPLEAWRSEGGAVVFSRLRSASRVSFGIPCGQCIGCRLERARQWGVRCMHEAKFWPVNSYVTLTYADEWLPIAGSLSLRDVQLFMKRLRKWHGGRVRFFLAGEYGDLNMRPHYHALLFNVGFRDRKVWQDNKRGEPLYVSEQLSRLWPLGHVSVGEVTFDSAVYCAKYALKRVNGEKQADHYTVFDSDGVVHVRRPEFAVMSRRPGIGSGYFDRFGNEVIDHDSVVVGGREVRPPLFYMSRAKERLARQHSDESILCMCQLCVNLRKRKRLAVLNRADNTEERLRVKERLMLLAAERKERKL